MSAEHLLLGLLGEPATVFDLKADLEDRARHLAAAELGELSDVVDALEERGWVSVERRGEPGPHSDLVRRTPEGDRALMDWLTAGGAVRPNDGEDPLRAHVLDQLGDPDAVRLMLATWRERLELWARRLLVEERELLRSSSELPDGPADGRFQAYLSLRLERATTRARLSWCEEALRLEGERERGELPRPSALDAEPGAPRRRRDEPFGGGR